MGLIKSSRLSVASEGNTVLSGAGSCRKLLWLLQRSLVPRGGGGDAVLGEAGRASRILLQPAGTRTLRPRGQGSVMCRVKQA